MAHQNALPSCATSTCKVHLRQPLTRYRLQKIVNARELDLIEPDPPATLQQLESYAEGTASQLLQLQVMCWQCCPGLLRSECFVPRCRCWQLVAGMSSTQMSCSRWFICE